MQFERSIRRTVRASLRVRLEYKGIFYVCIHRSSIKCRQIFLQNELNYTHSLYFVFLLAFLQIFCPLFQTVNWKHKELKDEKRKKERKLLPFTVSHSYSLCMCTLREREENATISDTPIIVLSLFCVKVTHICTYIHLQS